ncbi:MAG: hypothetical protein H0X39_05355 [Actinobacteria bacterium]|nr:hypothetical protein [Actinomycetota bacterium]
MIAAVLGVLLVAVLAFEVPHMIKLLKGSNAPTAAVATPPALQAPRETLRVLQGLRHLPASDPFSVGRSAGTDPVARSVPIPVGSVDPFATRAATAVSEPAITGSSTSSSPLPAQIVIGKPGGTRRASHGWIVILASIPTREGRGAATAFAANARRRGIDSVSVLNSSNRRPLRGGYWVVYTGPFDKLSGLGDRASGVHSHGYPTAYIRELIVYR